MSLKDKYHISNDVWIDLIRNGVISCSISKQEDILASVKRHKEQGTPHPEAVKLASEENRCTPEWVYEVIRRWNK